MKLSINKEAEKELLALPESGPGFQIVEAVFHGIKSTYIVWNAEFAINLKEAPISREDITGALLGSWINEQALSSITIIAAPSLHDFSLIGARVHSSVVSGYSAVSPPPSTLVKMVTLTIPRKFYRFSPFSNDRRIDPANGNFLPGTYCCPESEVPFVPSGFSAVGRFALPSALPASYRYEITSDSGINVLFGTVAPAYGQAGGGVEAHMPTGATNVTGVYVNPTHIGDD